MLNNAGKTLTMRCHCLLVLFLLPSVLYAQEIAGVSVEPKRSGIGETVRITVSFRDTENNVRCGLKLSMGDGQFREVRVSEKEVPLVVPYTYPRIGEFTVTVEGQGLLRGLNSAFACTGEPKTAVVSIVDLAAEREAARLKSELEERERQVKVREEELRQRELDDRERALSKKEEDLRRREQEATEKRQALKAAEVERRRRQAKSRDTNAVVPPRESPAGRPVTPTSPATPAQKSPSTLDAF